MSNPTGWKKTANELFERVRELEAENAALQVNLAEYRDLVTGWQAENARLTAALVECQEAFDSGRDVGERAGYGELEY